VVLTPNLRHTSPVNDNAQTVLSLEDKSKRGGKKYFFEKDNRHTTNLDDSALVIDFG
jgi:hypothetical protein